MAEQKKKGRTFKSDEERTVHDRKPAASADGGRAARRRTSEKQTSGKLKRT